jgi:glutamine synthetase
METIFGKQLIAEYVAIKKQEVRNFQTTVTNWELENYL